MAKGVYIGISGKSKKAKKLYIGIGGKAKKVKKAYIGVGGKAKLAFTSSYTWNRYAITYAWGKWNIDNSPKWVEGSSITYPIGDSRIIRYGDEPGVYIYQIEASSAFFYNLAYRYMEWGEKLCIYVTNVVGNGPAKEVAGFSYTYKEHPGKGTTSYGAVTSGSASTYPSSGVQNGYWYEQTASQRGSFIGVVTSDNQQAYPANGISGSYWYVMINT